MPGQAQLYPNNILHGSQDLIIDNGDGAGGFMQPSFVSPQKIQQQPEQQQLRQQNNERLWNQNMPVDINVLVSNSNANQGNNHNHVSIVNSHGLAAQFENQRQEIDQYIRLEDERLRIMLQEQGKQQLGILLKKLESQALYLLRQKDEELTQTTKRRVELEDFLRRLEAENQAWQRVAVENEAMVFSLHDSLEKMKEKAFYCPNHGFAAEDAESCCDESREADRAKDGKGTEENRGRFVEEQITRKMMVCKSCKSRSSCFLFLPCRHLCSCKACEPFLEACPVCREPKKASIETLIF